jgi:hypothetical protein
LPVGSQGIEEIVRIGFQPVKPGKEGFGIPGPENQAVHHSRVQYKAAYLVRIHRIADLQFPRLQAAAEPLGVEGGDIGAAAYTEDHGR